VKPGAFYVVKVLKLESRQFRALVHKDKQTRVRIECVPYLVLRDQSSELHKRLKEKGMRIITVGECTACGHIEQNIKCNLEKPRQLFS